MSFLSSRFEYRAALALNNMAITMMERRCYRQAFETFKDAVAAMKVARLSVEKADDSSERESVLGFLRKANQRSFRPNASRSVQAWTVVSHNCGHLEWILPSFEASSSPKDNNNNSSSNNNNIMMHFYLIRLDDADIFGSDDEELLQCDVLTIIMLYNFGMSYLCRAQTTSSTSAASKFRQGALKLLTLCRNLLAVQYESCEDLFVLPRLWYLSAIILQTLRQAFLVSGNVQDAMDCARVLQSLEQAAATSTNDAAATTSSSLSSSDMFALLIKDTTRAHAAAAA